MRRRTTLSRVLRLLTLRSLSPLTKVIVLLSLEFAPVMPLVYTEHVLHVVLSSQLDQRTADAFAACQCQFPNASKSQLEFALSGVSTHLDACTSCAIHYLRLCSEYIAGFVGNEDTHF